MASFVIWLLPVEEGLTVSAEAMLSKALQFTNNHFITIIRGAGTTAQSYATPLKPVIRL